MVEEERMNIYQTYQVPDNTQSLYIDDLIYFTPYKNPMWAMPFYLKILNEESKALER